MAVDDGGPEGGRVGVVEIVERHRCVEAVAQNLRAAVNGVVLGSGDGFQEMRVIALKTGHEGNTETAGEEGIFAVSFLATAPARISEDVDIRRPEGEAEVAAGVVMKKGVVVFGPCLGGYRVGDAVQ